MRRVDVEADVIKVGEPRHVNLKSGGETRTADITIRDGSGQVSLSLWDDQIDRVMVGQRIRISGGYTNSFRGDLKLQTGKYGKLEVLEEKNPSPIASSNPVGVAQPKKDIPKGRPLDAYYGSVEDLQETDLVGARQLLQQGWTLEKVIEKVIDSEDAQGRLKRETGIAYVLSRRA
jgi:replication factor A1